MFTGLTREICAQAWEIVDAGLAAAAKQGLAAGYQGNLVVLDPVARDGSILFTAHAGDANDHTLEYAMGKARLALRTGRDTSTLREGYAHLYAPDDIKYPGGIVRDGMVVAFSGIQGELDDMISEWFVATVRGICRLGFNGPDGGDAQPTPYLGRERQ